MAQFQSVVRRYFYLSLIFFAIGLIFGLFYSINLLGYSLDSVILSPQNIRSVHISLMLYGFIPLMLSYLPFFLIVKDLGFDAKAVRFLEIYTIFWYLFLLCMVFSFLMGVHRRLTFYDFHYSLNCILAFAGLFYIIAFYRYISLYQTKPLWIKVTLAVIIISPFALLILMNPVIGQVEATVQGPHGDNTLGMSLALIPIYYLVIKYLSVDNFRARWNILWIIPAIFYALSIAYRVFIGELSYAGEWFFQWLTFLYIPLLYRWYKDAKIEDGSKKYILISILAFLFVDIEGNILFIDSIRWLFHRNDLVIAHAHVAMGISLFFLTLSIYSNFIIELKNKFFVKIYLIGILGIFTTLSISGFVQAGFLNLPIETLWLFRTLFGLVAISSLYLFIKREDHFTPLKIYNLIGVLNDGVGGIFLFLLADYIYPLVGFRFDGTYEYIVFGFVSTTGILHYFAYRFKDYEEIFTKVTVIVRFIIASIFLSLYLSERLGIEALVISLFDICYATIYLILIYKKDLKECSI